MIRRSLVLRLAGLIVLASAPAHAEDSALSLADFAAYRVALSAKLDPDAPLVRFRDLWERPEAFAGRPVRVEGRVARLFRQGPIGDFPPLVEVWVFSASKDPFCLVFPRVDGQALPEVGAWVRFSGTFLKRIKYQGSDTARLAPLLVGSMAPLDSSKTSKLDETSWSSIDWMIVVGGSIAVTLVLVRRHLAQPIVRPTALEPPPIFVDGESETDHDHDLDEERDAHEG